MKAVVFGSLNIDRVYSLDSLPEKGETLRCKSYEIHVGGKGLNQAVALKKAGFDVSIAGAIGKDGLFLKEFLEKSGVDTSFVYETDGFTGHAVIEVDKNGQNQMILFPGANFEITEAYCDKILENYGKNDLILMQYETSCVEYMIKKAHEKGLFVVLNPSPFVKEIKNLDFGKIDFLILNESEGENLTGESEADKITDKLKKLNPDGKFVLTLGGDGAIFADDAETVKVPVFNVKAIDTTGAGDTFTGYFLKSYLDGVSPLNALKKASAASAIVVTKTGAAQTIPENDEVEVFLTQNSQNTER